MTYAKDLHNLLAEVDDDLGAFFEDGGALLEEDNDLLVLTETLVLVVS